MFVYNLVCIGEPSQQAPQGHREITTWRALVFPASITLSFKVLLALLFVRRLIKRHTIMIIIKSKKKKKQRRRKIRCKRFSFVMFWHSHYSASKPYTTLHNPEVNPSSIAREIIKIDKTQLLSKYSQFMYKIVTHLYRITSWLIDLGGTQVGTSKRGHWTRSFQFKVVDE